MESNTNGAHYCVGIIGAMQVEVDSLVQDMSGISESDLCGLRFFTGKLRGVDVVVVRSGVGKVNAALCASALCLRFAVTHIINTGIAGAMAAGLNVSDFVVSSDAMYYDMDATGFGYKRGIIPQMECSDFAADAALIAAVEKAHHIIEGNCTDGARHHKLVKGRVASGDRFVSERALKEDIKALCDPACVEMEGAGIAHACYLNGVPYVIVRCMSDKADDGEEATYAFNEKECAASSAQLVKGTLEVLSQGLCIE